MTVDEQSSAVDWEVAAAVAEGLGRATLLYVARRDADAVREWALQMSRVYVGEGNALRALSYLELAMLTGHHEEEVDDLAERGWDELVGIAERSLAAIRLHAKETADVKASFEATAAKLEAEVARLEAEAKAEDDGNEPDAGGIVEAAEDQEAGA